MLNSSKNSDACGIETKSRPIKFITNLFRRRRADSESSKDMNKGPVAQPVFPTVNVARVPSTLSVKDIMVTAYPTSPALSTPAKNRDIDLDMEALRISRHDNPFLKQVLASRESLADSLEESESDDTNLMSQEYLNDFETDPLSLPEVHEHMIRSPPPTSWPRSPNFKMFRFPNEGDCFSQDHGKNSSSLSRSVSPRQDSKYEGCHENFQGKSLLSPKLSFPVKLHQRSSGDLRERNFTLLTPAPLRSLTDVRRLNVRSDEDSQYLVASENMRH